MKKRLFVILLFILTVFQLSAQTSSKFNQYNVLYKGSWMPVVTLFTNYDYGNKWSFTNYFYVNAQQKTGWGEGLVGPTYSPTKWLNISLLGGIQSNEKSLLRGGPVIFAKSNNMSFFCAMEFGGKRYRWDIMAFYVWPHVKLGAELIRFYQMYATGPRCEFTFLKKQPLTIFYSALWDYSYGNYASMFGIYTGFPIRK
ncbi:MAG: hypothetical protein WCO63_00385 [Bacteroidota bacterium]